MSTGGDFYKITFCKGAPWLAASFFVFFGNLLLVNYISHWCLSFFWASACICIAVDAIVVAADLKASEKHVEELADQISLHSATCSQMLKKMDENFTIMLEIRARFLHHNNRATFQYTASQKKSLTGTSFCDVDARREKSEKNAKLSKSASFG